MDPHQTVVDIHGCIRRVQACSSIKSWKKAHRGLWTGRMGAHGTLDQALAGVASFAEASPEEEARLLRRERKDRKKAKKQKSKSKDTEEGHKRSSKGMTLCYLLIAITKQYCPRGSAFDKTVVGWRAEGYL